VRPADTHGKVVATIDLGGKPEFGVSDLHGTVFVNIEDTNTLAVFDSRSLAVTARWSLAPCDEPTGLALDAAHKRLFVGCHNKRMMVVDASTGRIVASLPIGEGVDGTAFDPSTGLAYASNGDGTLTVVHEDSPESFRVVQNVQTQRGARTLALDPATHKVYLVTAQFGPPPAPTAERPATCHAAGDGRRADRLPSEILGIASNRFKSRPPKLRNTTLSSRGSRRPSDVGNCAGSPVAFQRSAT